jgi:tetratricopeptide (TPR) repeat protein
MGVLANGLSDARRHEDAMAVYEADLSMKRRVGASADSILAAQSNLATTYENLGQRDQALRMRLGIYSGWLKLNGEEHEYTIRAAYNYAVTLLKLERFEEAKALLRKTMPVARRVLGENRDTTLMMRWNYASVLVNADDATLDDIREAATTLEETERIARRVFGGTHPIVTGVEQALQQARAGLVALSST